MADINIKPLTLALKSVVSYLEKTSKHVYVLSENWQLGAGGEKVYYE